MSRLLQQRPQRGAPAAALAVPSRPGACGTRPLRAVLTPAQPPAPGGHRPAPPKRSRPRARGRLGGGASWDSALAPPGLACAGGTPQGTNSRRVFRQGPPSPSQGWGLRGRGQASGGPREQAGWSAAQTSPPARQTARTPARDRRCGLCAIWGGSLHRRAGIPSGNRGRSGPAPQCRGL